MLELAISTVPKIPLPLELIGNNLNVRTLILVNLVIMTSQSVPEFSQIFSSCTGKD